MSEEVAEEVRFQWGGAVEFLGDTEHGEKLGREGGGVQRTSGCMSRTERGVFEVGVGGLGKCWDAGGELGGDWGTGGQGKECGQMKRPVEG